MEIHESCNTVCDKEIDNPKKSGVSYLSPTNTKESELDFRLSIPKVLAAPSVSPAYINTLESRV